MRQLNRKAPCLALSLAFLPLTGCRPATAAPAAPVWLYAVVFHLSDGAASYAGVADVSSASGVIQQLLDSAPTPTEASKSTLAAPPGADDIWLEGNGRSAEVVWNPAAGTYSVVQNGRMTRPVADDGLFRPLVASIRPFLEPDGFGRNAASPTAAIAIFDYPPGPHTLAGMVRASPVIVRGRVVAVLREQHVPENYAGPNEETTLLVAVERYLRGGPGAPPVVKVTAPGGDLPWSDAVQGRNGVGYRRLDEPMPMPGRRYIMFLHLAATYGRGPLPPRTALYAEIHGLRGKAGEADEFIVSVPFHSKILLHRGVATALPSEGETAEWKFADGEQIVGIPASQAEAAILHAVAKVDALPANHATGGRAGAP
ncbi:MAG: hypothetical protein KGJ62_01915 [Armatimonadetes bacterium]|nr:hypothetical protein [Armatimonadota bacterium]MDE2206734.1 hypothetical protein [Armatimonadota bacterium]